MNVLNGIRLIIWYHSCLNEPKPDIGWFDRSFSHNFGNENSFEMFRVFRLSCNCIWKIFIWIIQLEHFKNCFQFATVKKKMLFQIIALRIHPNKLSPLKTVIKLWWHLINDFTFYAWFIAWCFVWLVVSLSFRNCQIKQPVLFVRCISIWKLQIKIPCQCNWMYSCIGPLYARQT